MIHQRNKGKRGELLLVKYLAKLGFKGARRGQQYSGIDGRDVVCDDLPLVHIECKFGYKCELGSKQLLEWWKQSYNDAADDEAAVVFWKPTNARQWRMSLFWHGVFVTVANDQDIRKVLLRLNDVR